MKAVGLLCLSLVLLILPTLYTTLWPLLLISLVPIFLVLKTPPTKWVAFLVFLVGFLYYSVVTYPLATLNTWWWTSTNGFFWQNRDFIYILGSSVLAFICSILTFGVCLYIYGRFFKKYLATSIIALPFLWILLELVRVKILFNLDWGIYGYQLGENLFFARAASLGGPMFLTLIAITANICFFILVLRWKTAVGLGKKLIPILFLAIIFLFIAGHIQTSAQFQKNTGNDQNTAEQSHTPGISVAIINPSLETEELRENIGAERALKLIEAAAAGIKDKSGIIISPENTFPSLTIDENAGQPINNNELSQHIFKRLTKVSTAHPEITFIIGLHTEKSGGTFNSAVALESGRVISIANKRNLLPLTEKSYGFLRKNHIDPLSAGENGILSTQHGAFQADICSEILVPVAHKDRENTNILAILNLSNDNVFDSARVGEHNMLMSRIRAVETGKPVIRSSKGGFSGMFDATGAEVLAEKNETGEILFTTLGYPRKSLLK